MTWVRVHPRPHRCALPAGSFSNVPGGAQRGELWRCDTCRQLWRIGGGGPFIEPRWRHAWPWTRIRYNHTTARAGRTVRRTVLELSTSLRDALDRVGDRPYVAWLLFFAAWILVIIAVRFR